MQTPGNPGVCMMPMLFSPGHGPMA